jgi:hypothetical protein
MKPDVFFRHIPTEVPGINILKTFFFVADAP